jgi:hypothetical protein
MTCDEIIAMYEEGNSSKGDALSQIARAVADSVVADMLRTLPESWQKEVKQWIFDIYDNDIDSDDFISFGDPDPDLQARRRQIGRLREWIRSEKRRAIP